MSSIPPDTCFICCSTLNEGTVVNVQKRGIETLIAVSEKRGLVQNKRFLLLKKEVLVHDACRKKYTVESNVAASIRRGGDKDAGASTSCRDSSDSSSRHHILNNMTAVRPRSFLSPVQISFGAYLYRKFGSTHLVNLCDSMGFSCSYQEAKKVEYSSIVREDLAKLIEKGAFMQFVWDNADVNVNTLDGKNTFHKMGGIMIITPHSSVQADKNIPRLKYVSADTIASLRQSQLKSSTVSKNAGLSAITIADVKIAEEILPTRLDLLWLFGKSEKTPGIPGWNGFMEQVTQELPYKRSKVIFQPFIHAPPTDYDTVLTSLLESSEKTMAHSQKTCFVTYDQPLYMKARDIVESCQYPQLRNVVVRLGGFHLLMSFMGSIGSIMAGSGLKELLATIFAENSVDKMMNGHAYARAVRAHILTNLALASFIIKDEMHFTEEERNDIEMLLSDSERSQLLHSTDHGTLQILVARFKSALDELRKRGPTSKLWVEYYKMTTLMKKFIQAERMGDWDLHLETIAQMLPFFHSAGHFLYAKSARLYLQDMSTLKDRMDPTEFQLFTQGGYFTIRRSDKFWSGLWTDLTIEQVLMRSMKSQGGLTHGRGISDSVLARWTSGMVSMMNICEGVEHFWGTTSSTCEEHVDRRSSRIKRDTVDVEKLRTWFDAHNPFPLTSKLMSISSGIVGNPDVNCHLARELGLDGAKQIAGGSFGKVSFKRKDKVKTLASATIKVNDKKVDIDPLTIFQRLCVTKQSENHLQEHFKFELAPYPMSLFTEEGMRKGTKSTFYSAFTPLDENIAIEPNYFVVVDGGFLLHKVIWHRNDSIAQIVATYTRYVRHHFGHNVTVVFDGYPEDGNSTKTAERLRRYAATPCVDIMFESSTLIKMPQDKMLMNDNNKRRLIDFLCSGFHLEGIETYRATEDADSTIIRTALEKCKSNEKVFIIGEDVDLLVLLCALGSSVNNVFFQKSGRADHGPQQYTTKSFNQGEVQYPPGLVLFVHAFTGCDTTSALFWQGKNKMLSALEKDVALVDVAATFLKPDVSHEEVASAGISCFVALYGGKEGDKLHTLRYKLFVRSAANAKVNLARLPPTEEAAAQHSYRTYHQVQTWLGIDKEPTEWGWTKREQGLFSISNTAQPASPELLKLISCKCKKGCMGGCSCRKAGLVCSGLCSTCLGRSCQNKQVIELEDSDDEAEIDDPAPIYCPPEPSTEDPGPSKRRR